MTGHQNPVMRERLAVFCLMVLLVTAILLPEIVLYLLRKLQW